MRLFVAVDLDEAARGAAARAATGCARVLDEAGVGVRWMPAEQLHLTLYESRVSSRGATYHVVDMAELAPAGTGKRGSS